MNVYQNFIFRKQDLGPSELDSFLKKTADIGRAQEGDARGEIFKKSIFKLNILKHIALNS
jgi:hypothetical protein